MMAMLVFDLHLTVLALLPARGHVAGQGDEPVGRRSPRPPAKPMLP